jgi:hypothetical protein
MVGEPLSPLTSLEGKKKTKKREEEDWQQENGREKC